MTPYFSYFISDLLEDTEKHIEVMNEQHVTAKQKGQALIKMGNTM